MRIVHKGTALLIAASGAAESPIFRPHNVEVEG